MKRTNLAMLSIALICVLTITLGVVAPIPAANAVADSLTLYVRENANSGQHSNVIC